MKKLKYYIMSAVLLFTIVTPVYATESTHGEEISILVPSEISTFALTGETWTVTLDYDISSFINDGNTYKIPKSWIEEYYTLIYKYDNDLYIYVCSEMPSFVIYDKATIYYKSNTADRFSFVSSLLNIRNKDTLTVTQSSVSGYRQHVDKNFIFSNFDIVGNDGKTYHTSDVQRIPAECIHTGGTATCTAKAICDTCGEEYGEIDRNNHTGTEEIRGALDPTEVTDGYTGDKYMTCCNELIETGTFIPSTGSGSGTDPEPPPEDDITINEKVKIDYSDRNFFTTPLNDYTVTEGLLLFIFIFIAFDSLFKSRMKG